MKIYRTKFHPDRSRNMGSVGGNYVTSLSISATAHFHETRTTALLYKTLIIEFHENPTIDLAAYNRSQMDGST